MKLKLLFFFLILGFIQLNSQNVVLGIVSTDNSEKNIDINNLRNITFFDSNLKLTYLSGTNEMFPTSSIRKLVFTFSTGLKKLIDTKNVMIYPNPVVDIVSFKNTFGENLDISIYSVTGAKVLNINQLYPTQTINISHLTKGMYFLKVNNQILKFIKL